MVEELVPELLSYRGSSESAAESIRERLPIRNLVTILEVLADNARVTRDLDFLTESVRGALRRTITKLYGGQEGKLHVITLHPEVEQALAEGMQQTQNGSYPVLKPEGNPGDF